MQSAHEMVLGLRGTCGSTDTPIEAASLDLGRAITLGEAALCWLLTALSRSGEVERPLGGTRHLCTSATQ